MKRASLHSEEHIQLVQLLRDLRLEAQLSQAEVAELLGRPQTYVSAIEVRDRGLDLLQVRELAALYGKGFVAFAKLFEARIKAPVYRPPRRKRSR